MTPFEYLATGSSLLYSVAALRVLGGIPSALDPARRYSLHVALTFVLLALVLIDFWVFWSFRDVEWTFLGFVFALLNIFMLYYCAAALIPENPETVKSWREHYFTMRRRTYGGLAAYGLAFFVNVSVNLGLALQHRSRAVQLTFFAVGVAGMASARPRVHGLLVLILALMMATASLVLGIDASWVPNS
jgi:hypothetical protein